MLNHTHSFARLVLIVGLIGFSALANQVFAVNTPYNIDGNKYTYRQEITVSSSLTSSNLTDYPLLIQVTNPANPIFTNAIDGTDIVFTAGDGVTTLPREIETFTTGGSPMLNAWVKSDVSSSTDTKIYMYYKGAGVADSPNTWDSNFTLVQHLEEDPSGTLFDSTSFGNNGTNAGTVSAPGKIGPALDFDGSSTVNLGNDISLFPTDVTLEAWVKSDVVNTHNGIFTNKSGAQYGFNLQTGTTQNLSGLVGGGVTSSDWTYVGANATGDPNTVDWYHLTLTHENGNENRLYVNGAPVGVIQTQGLAYAAGPLPQVQIGAFYTGGTLKFNGIIDELRLSNTARSADWIMASYLLGDNAGAFLSFSAQQEAPPIPEPSSIMLLGLGLIGLVRTTRQRKQRG